MPDPAGPPLPPAVRAAIERLVPSDDGLPGAREAGTWRFVAARAGEHGPTAAACARLDELLGAAARDRGGAAFAALPAADQDAVLAALEASGEPAFRTLLVATLEGFYGDPRHGGNAEAVSWALIGFPGPTGGSGYRAPLGWYDEHDGGPA